jgi:hypothetical protein
VRATGLKFEDRYTSLGKIEIVISTIEAAQNDVAHNGMTAISVLQLPNACSCFGTKSG